MYTSYTQALTNIIIITGHYGSGKTNLAINLALDLKKQGREVALCDLDIVNPYFRSSDFELLAKKEGIELVKPGFANSNLDIPSLNISFDSYLGSDTTLIIDVGGDDAGAIALGRYSQKLLKYQYDMLYVVNSYRMMIETPDEAADMLAEIECAARIKATCVVNNSHLAHETTAAIVLDSMDYAEKTAKQCGLPLVFSTMKKDLYEQLTDKSGFYPVDVLVDLPWYK